MRDNYTRQELWRAERMAVLKQRHESRSGCRRMAKLILGLILGILITTIIILS